VFEQVAREHDVHGIVPQGQLLRAPDHAAGPQGGCLFITVQRDVPGTRLTEARRKLSGPGSDVEHQAPAGFHDPPAPDRPTLFQWAGGLPALTRMTRIFYEKHVPEDPLLAPLFANMSPDHPVRVARWLGEVFGGPKLYSETYGGYDRMISQHLGKALTEEKRA